MTKEQFSRLLQKFLDRQLTDEELTMFMDAAENKRFESMITESLQRDLQEIRKIIGGDAEKKQKVWTAVRSLTGISSVERLNPHPLYTLETDVLSGAANPAPATPIKAHAKKTAAWKWMAAASVLLLFSAGYYWLQHADKTAELTESGPALINDIPPGGNRATLTLADGRVIVLDETEKGLVTHQGAVEIVKHENGEISYRVTGQANDRPMTNTMSTPIGGQYQLALPDGTKVWLNALSSIVYPTRFTGGERKVKVSGEAYFEVTANKQQPFVVESGEMEIHVLGTHFNVNAYADETDIKTTLVEGSVNISYRGEKVMLSPGEQARIRYGGGLSVADEIDLQEVMAWKSGYFQFTSANMKTILREISRWYDAEFVYNDDIPLHFTGQLNRSRTLSELFRELALTGELQFRIEGKKIIVSPKISPL